MTSHKHDWKASEFVGGILGTFSIRLVWQCVRGKCNATRTEQLRIRKPRRDAVTDGQKSWKLAEKMSEAHYKTKGKSTPKQPEPLEELDFHEWLEIEPMVKEPAAGLNKTPVPLEPIPQEVMDWLEKNDYEKFKELSITSLLLQGKKIMWTPA